MTRHALAAMALALGLGLGACSDPYHDAAPGTNRRSEQAGELPGRIPERELQALTRPRTRPATTAREAVARHARLLVNWTAATIQRRYRAAADAAVGQARRDAEQTVASARTDRQLTGAGTVSRGELVTIVEQPAGWRLAVTREQITPDAGGARYRVYRAHTRRVPGGVAVDAWEPQP